MEVESATAGREDVRHLLAALEFQVPIGPATFSAEGFYGEAGGYNSGVGQTVVIGTNGDADPVISRGGWAQLTVPLADKVDGNLLYGFDNPGNSGGGTALTIERNDWFLGNIFWHITDNFAVALELEYVETDYSAGNHKADDFRTTLAFILNF